MSTHYNGNPRSTHLMADKTDRPARGIGHRIASDPDSTQPRPTVLSSSHSAGVSTLPSWPNQRYQQDRTQLDRTQLGVAHDWVRDATPHMPPPRPHPRAVSQNLTPSTTPPPVMTRSRTLDGRPLIHNDSYRQLPLTIPPLQHPLQVETGHNYNAYREASLSASIQSAQSVDRFKTEDGSGRGNRSNKSKRNGPPKAKLGGRGGKTFDEMLAAGQVKERKVSPAPSATLTSEGSVAPPKTAEEKEILVNIPSAGAAGVDILTQMPHSSSRRDTLDSLQVTQASSDAVGQEDAGAPPLSKSYKGKEIVVSVPKSSTLVSDRIEAKPRRDSVDGPMWSHDSFGTHNFETAPSTRPQNSANIRAQSNSHQKFSSGGPSAHDGGKVIETPLKSTTASASTSMSTPNLAGLASLPPRPNVASQISENTPRKQLRIRGSAESPQKELASPSMTTEAGAGQVVGKRTISAAGIGSNPFLRKSLGGLFRDKDAQPSRRPRSSQDSGNDIQTDPKEPQEASDEKNENRVSPVSSLRKATSSLLNGVIVDTSAPEFEDVPLVTPEGPYIAKGDNQSGLDDATVRINPVTITPGRSRKLASLLQDSVSSADTVSEEALGQATDAPALVEALFELVEGIPERHETPQNRAETIEDGNQSLPDHIASSALSMRTASTSSADSISPSKEVRVKIDTSLAKDGNLALSPRPVDSPTLQPTRVRMASTSVRHGTLRPSAPSFVPAEPQFASLTAPMPVLGAASIRSVSFPVVTASASPLGDRRSSLDSDELQVQKRVKLRPSAATFVPRPSTLSRRPAPFVSTVSSGPRIVSDSFTFEPQLPFRTNTAAFAPPLFEHPQNSERHAALSHLYPSNALGYVGPFALQPFKPDPVTTRSRADVMAGPQIHRSQASPRLASAGWGRSDDQHVEDQPNAADDQGEAEERPPFHERPNPLRKAQNSHRSIETPRLGSPQLSPEQVTIHPSLPLLIPPVLSPDILRSPENPLRGYEAGFAVSSEVHAAIDQLADDQDGGSRPVVASPGEMSTPSKHQNGSITDTYTTADGSPLLPRRLTPLPSPSRAPGLALPALLRPELPSVAESPVMDSNSITADLAFSQPEIRIDVASDDRRFREWTYPNGERGRRPSISRRHTMPTDDPEIVHRPVGIASTFSDRVQDLRHLLGRNSLDEGPDGEGNVDHAIARRGASTQSSVEFPLREEKKTLAVVNDTPQRLLGSSSDPAHQEPSVDIAEKMDQVLHALSRLETSVSVEKPEDGLASKTARILGNIQDKFGKIMSDISASREETQAAMENIESLDIPERIAEILERQTILISSIHQKGDDHGETVQSTKQMFETILTGQHAVLDKIAESLSDRQEASALAKVLDQVKSTQNEMAGALSELRVAQGEIETLRSRLDASNGDIIRLEAERESKIENLSHVMAEMSGLRERVEGADNRLETSRSKEQDLQNDIETLMSARMAAEAERDALAEALRAGMEETERLSQEKESLHKQISEEREKHNAANAQAISLSGISAAASAFHEEILSRMARLDEGMHETMGSRVKEYEAVLDGKSVMQIELDRLREQLEQATATIAAMKLDHQSHQSKYELRLAETGRNLEHETEAKQKVDHKVESLEKQLEQARADRETALLVASERASWVRMMDVRHQALSQENVYWRQFALESDRRKYNAYVASNPFQSTTAHSPPDAQLKTPGADAMHDAGSGETPTRPGVVGRSLINDGAEDVINGNGGGHVKPVSSDDEGTWWNVA